MNLKSKNGYSALACFITALSLSACNSDGTTAGSTPNNSSDSVLASGDTAANTQVSNSAPVGSDTSSTNSNTTTNTNPSTNTQVPTPATSSNPNPSSSPAPTTPSPTPSVTPTPPSTVVGSSCHSSDPNMKCLALKYVVYNDSSGKPVVTKDQAINNLTSINSVWKKCNVAFQIDEYLAATPSQYNLTFNTANSSELDVIRERFESDSELVVVTTGLWNRSGSLGNTGANAWANMPGMNLYGVVMESAVGTYPNIIAHELGHYLGLDHASDASNLLSPIIYETSTNLTTSQCNEVLSTIRQYWDKMIR